MQNSSHCREIFVPRVHHWCLNLKTCISFSLQGWENLTDAVIHWLNEKQINVVFLLWGANAQKKGSFINRKKHCVLASAHPSPLSAYKGFMGNKHFSKTNDYLQSVGKTPIDWKDLPKNVAFPEE